MMFTDDTDLVLRHAAALVNSAPGHGASGAEDLPDLEAVLAWMAEWGWSGGRPTTTRDVTHLHRVRARIGAVWSAPLGEQVDAVNLLLARTRALPRLVEHDGQGWHVHATDDDAPFADRVAVEFAMAMVDVIRAGECDRLAVCSAEHCDDVYVDLSRNRSRKFCEGTCGTRANVAAYRARKAARA
ncbi:CGNR zinc finger domain-containing protein [Nostocoides sp. Soil756]|jgi:predicted RNA-binding Zn ribbon-like protein|uniref:CGNR zinc finger domain-containing protein n=1 Tax=Nostocoides sp. Soil756 TaxID=1736399 RepID=UPI0006FABEE6|nr:CGNR zinc finger domain-containing protein [Tetrasphaera sp. Soil756]KRE62020.1 RNA-binding protein [Tetrasphaera sp. Soil756]